MAAAGERQHHRAEGNLLHDSSQTDPEMFPRQTGRRNRLNPRSLQCRATEGAAAADFIDMTEGAEVLVI